jgi:hypothetical protein
MYWKIQNTDNNEETELTLRKGGRESRPGIAQESITIKSGYAG